MLIAGNWKMHGSRGMAADMLEAVNRTLQKASSDAVEVAVFPPATLLSFCKERAQPPLMLGGQDCHSENTGAYTGDVSADMLKEAGASYCLVGHSERRQYHGEHDAQIQGKANAAHEAGLKPLICIGETEAQQAAGQTQAILKKQIQGAVPSAFTPADFVLAYEPVWAIGTGKVATPEQIAETHHFIQQQLPEGATILYGGSVKPDNIAEILALEPVHGVLVGGASLKAESFCKMITLAMEANNRD